jgi:DNA-binding PadR family transcriptional regulator
MFAQTIDELVLEEMETVEARKVILDQLEGGQKSGSELRESIRKARAVKELGRKRISKKDLEQFTVTDPKLYGNTKRLENLGIITSRRKSQQRIFSLNPKAVHPVRRVLGISRPKSLITAFAQPENIRPFVTWICKQDKYNLEVLRLIVEEARFKRGVSKDIDRYIPDGTKKRWEEIWHELPIEVAGDNNSGIRGDLMATYQEIEAIILEDITNRECIVDLSMGPPTILVAMHMLANEYSLSAIYVERHEGESNDITQVFPWKVEVSS